MIQIMPFYNTCEIIFEEKETKRIKKLLTQEPLSEKECMSEDETIIYTVHYPDGIEMDIKICGVQYEPDNTNLPWTEAVLFKDGSEVACSEVSDDIFGEWTLHYNGTDYISLIKGIGG